VILLLDLEKGIKKRLITIEIKAKGKFNMTKIPTIEIENSMVLKIVSPNRPYKKPINALTTKKIKAYLKPSLISFFNSNILLFL